MQEIAAHFKDDAKVAVVTIQTTFEGFSVNDFAALREIADRYSLTIPMGHSGWPDRPSPILYSYQARGTPWVVIIDKKGLIVFNNFYQKPADSIRLIDSLKKQH